MSTSPFVTPALTLLFLAGASLPAQDARKDAHGDALPPGAITRLGSVQFRHPDTITAVAFSPDGKTLFAAGADKAIRVWDPDTGRLRRTVQGHTEEVRGLAVTPDGKSLVSAGLDRSLRVWDLRTFEQSEELEKHEDCIE
jgi:WD40 repeat protein